MKAIKIEHDSDYGQRCDTYIHNAGMVQIVKSDDPDFPEPYSVSVRAIDENNHVVGKPIIVDLGWAIHSVEEVEV